MTITRDYKNVIFYILTALIIFYGIFLRIKVYLASTPFWYDEALLGISFYKINFIDIFKGISDYTKIPPLWGLSIKLIIQIFGYSAQSLRLMPFLASIISLFSFFILLKNTFKNNLAILTGLIIFAVNYRLLYYCAEFRPYASDVLVCILLLLSYKYISFKNLPPPRAFLYTAISIILILFSFPSIIVIPAMIITKCIEEKHFNHKCLLIFFGIFITCIYLYFIDRNCYQFMNYYWNHIEIAFWDFSITSLNNLFSNLYKYIFDLNRESIIQYFDMALCTLGFVLFIKNKQQEGYLILFIFLTALLASLLKIFPFGYRHGLYLIPIVILLLIRIIDIKQKSIILLILLFTILALTNSYKRISFNNNIEYYMNNNSNSNINVKYKNLKFIRKIIKESKDENYIIVQEDPYAILKFYHNIEIPEKKIKYYITPYLYKDKIEIINKYFINTLNEISDAEKFYIIGLYNTSSDPVEPDFIESELKSRNYKYKKDKGINFYTYSVYKE